MRVNDLYSYDNSNISATLRVDGMQQNGGVAAGDILEGLVTGVDQNTHVTFEQLNKHEVVFENSAVKNAYVGEKRRFEVVSASTDKLVLRDLGGIAANIDARACMSAQVDYSMPKMVSDFEETMGTKKDEDTDSIKNLSDDDYSELAAEGFSIEDYKADRLVRALDRIKTNRAARRESIAKQGEAIKAEEKAAKRRAAKAVADKYAAHAGIIDALADADLPITEENVEGILNTIAMSAEACKMTSNSYAYLIGRELEPTVNNIYRSVYSGSIRRMEISPADWAGIRQAADDIVNEANGRVGNPVVSVRDAHWLVEYDIPLTADNLIYKNELEKLTETGLSAEETTRAAALAIQQGRVPEDALMIASYGKGTEASGTREDSDRRKTFGGAIEQLLGQLRLQMRRLEMATSGGMVAKASGMATDATSIQKDIDTLRTQIRDYYERLAEEMGTAAEEGLTATDKTGNPVDLAIETSLAVDEIGNAPVTLYGVTFTTRAEITLAGLAAEAVHLTAERASMNYEASATQIRADLGDSIGKAFNNIDSLLEEIDMEATDANVRAVKILGYNSMEITAENVESIKYYDAKVTAMVEAMKPAVVMAMIKRGYNPLEQDIDTINREIAEIEEEEGVSAEERFSSFLVRLEAVKELPDEVRDAYIGIYRLLYQIERSDGAAIGAAINSGRRLTLENLLTESRTGRSGGIDAKLGDENEIIGSSYTNSITAQIDNAFTKLQQERITYNLQIAREAAKVTNPEVWKEALQEAAADKMTPEQVAERLARADAQISDGAIEAAAEHIRSTMSAPSAARKFLRSIGAVDSTRNIDLLESEGEDLTLGFDSADELLKIAAGEDTLARAFERAADMSAEKLGRQLEFSPDIRTEISDLTKEADRFGLLRHLAGRQHYRMSIGDENPARINLTVIHSEEKSGSMSLEVSTSRYHVRAELRMTTRAEDAETGADRLFGRVTCDSTSELVETQEALTRFVSAVRGLNIETDGLTSGVDRLSPDMYLTRLGEMRQRAGITDDEEGHDTKPATAQLFSIARLFVETFL